MLEGGHLLTKPS